jgi:pimeloyl-ACP methyl ester carboxylesterase
MDTATQAALYSESEWPVLAAGLAAAEKGAGDQILAMGDQYNGRHDDGTYDTLFQSFGIIKCASGITTQPPDDPEALLKKIHEQAPRFGKDVTVEDLTPVEGEDYDGCTELMGTTAPVELAYSGEGPIVVVGGTNDPATPIRWAEEMTAALGPNATMVKYTGEGHVRWSAPVSLTRGALSPT